jgi:DNA mismatch repair protein MutL
VDVNVHPAKTEVKFLNEKSVFDCIHYGVLGTLNKTPDRPEVQFKPVQHTPVQPQKPAATPVKHENFFRTMTPQAYKSFSAAVIDATQPKKEAAAATALKIETKQDNPVRDTVVFPQFTLPDPVPAKPVPVASPAPTQAEPEQAIIPMPEETPWRMVGELYRTYIIVEEGEEAFLIDKHAAHERIIYEKLKAEKAGSSAQILLQPVTVTLGKSEYDAAINNLNMFADCSFGGSAYRAGNTERHDFYFGNLDPFRMAANSELQAEFDPPKLHLRIDPFDNQRGEAEYADRGLIWTEVKERFEMLEMVKLT